MISVVLASTLSGRISGRTSRWRPDASVRKNPVVAACPAVSWGAASVEVVTPCTVAKIVGPSSYRRIACFRRKVRLVPVLR